MNCNRHLRHLARPAFARLGAALCLVGLSLPAGAAAPPAPQPPLATLPLTIAVADSPYAAPALVAEAEGYFAAEGLALKVLHCSIGRVCLKHLLDGEAHFATVADTPVTIASFTRRDFAIVATMTTSGREHRIIVRDDRGIGGPADLKGKRMGVLIGTSAHFFAETYLLFHGVVPAGVTLVPLDPKDAIGPLVRGEVDAAAMFDPHSRDALNTLATQGHALPAPNFFVVTFNLVSVPAAAGGRDEDLVKLLRALQRAVTLIQAEPDRARAIVANALKVDPSLVADSWKSFDFRIELAQPLITTLESQARWAMRSHQVPANAVMPDYLDFLRPEPLKRVNPRALRLVD